VAAVLLPLVTLAESTRPVPRMLRANRVPGAVVEVQVMTDVLFGVSWLLRVVRAGTLTRK
jgi:hypothetical protein